ncbi:MAG: hypothetical protein C5B49_04460 [Bdellovibrio sp.]|nr:MAG: hypothetical protein C5B49_04460 [Bdellovibrio sp.]
MGKFFLDNLSTVRFVSARALVFFMSAGFSSICLAQTALVIIDMQPYFAERGGYHNLVGNQEKIEKVLNRQVELIEMAKSNRLPIVTIEYSGCGSTCTAIKKAIGNYGDARTFVKSSDGMFSNWGGIENELDTYLKGRNTSQLIITGANGGYCVKCSIEGALNKGYRVWTDADAVADFNFEEFKHPYYYKDGQITGAQKI